MKVHHLNCGSMCPLGGKLFLGSAPELVCHCLLVETDAHGLVLVDAGLGTRDVAEPVRRLGRGFQWIVRPKLSREETALHQIERLGFKAGDVRHVILTHLDVDHAGGLADFPDAQAHVFSPELDAALSPSTVAERARYRPVLFDHGPRWVRQYARGEPWFGFECVRQPEGLPPELLLVPLVGHSRGHTGVAVHHRTGWLLHSGDAYLDRGELATPPLRAPGVMLHERATAFDHGAAAANIARLGELARNHPREVQVFCAHDRKELAALSAPQP